MKVLIEADSIVLNKLSGIGHTTLELARTLDQLSEKDENFRVVLIVPRGKAQLVRGYGWRNVKVRELPWGQKYWNYLFTRTPIPFPAELLFGRGIYIFPNYKTWYTPFSKSVTFVHDVVFKIHPETVHPKNLVYLQANFSRWLKRASRIISITKASADELKHYFPQYSAKISVVHLGINPKVFRKPSGADIAAVRLKYAIPEHYFIYVGNLEPRKNIGYLLDAYQRYADSTNNPYALLLVGGDGWKNEQIKDQLKLLHAKNYPIYKPQHYVPDQDLPALYGGAAALVHVALHEGFGLSPLQAQACGTPVIVSDIPAIKEVVDSEHATFVPLDNVHLLTQALEDAVHKKHFSPRPVLTWNNTALAIERIIDKM